MFCPSPFSKPVTLKNTVKYTSFVPVDSLVKPNEFIHSYLIN